MYFIYAVILVYFCYFIHQDASSNTDDRSGVSVCTGHAESHTCNCVYTCVIHESVMFLSP